MLDQNVVNQNKGALKALGTRQEIEGRFEKDPSDAMFFLRSICGFRCAGCGGNRITGPILKFYDYSPEALCYHCQEENR
jgi:hypothetical protein